MADLDSGQILLLAQKLVEIGDSAGALKLCAGILTANPDHQGARALSAAIQCRSGLIAAYRINLARRPDRLAKALRNQAKYGYPDGFIARVEAIEDPDYGAIGCGKSHIAALTDAFINRSEPYCLVLEDDFDFLEPAYRLVEDLAKLAASGAVWDVLMLGGVSPTPYSEAGTPPSLLRLFESRCAAGYLVRRHYLPKLLDCFIEAVAQLERYRGLNPRLTADRRLPIDIAWRPLQQRDRWYLANPALGHQRHGYSDIERGFLDYSARNFYMLS